MSEELINNPEMEVNNEEQVVETPQIETVEVEQPVVEMVKEELPEVEVAAPKKAKVIENAYPSLDEFNWDSIEKKGSKYSVTDQERYEDLYTKSFKSIDENEVILGSVVSINSREKF